MSSVALRCTGASLFHQAGGISLSATGHGHCRFLTARRLTISSWAEPGFRLSYFLDACLYKPGSQDRARRRGSHSSWGEDPFPVSAFSENTPGHASYSQLLFPAAAPKPSDTRQHRGHPAGSAGELPPERLEAATSGAGAPTTRGGPQGGRTEMGK